MGMAHSPTVSELAAVLEAKPLLSEAVAAFLLGEERHQLPECRQRVHDFGLAFLSSLVEGQPMPVGLRCVCGERKESSRLSVAADGVIGGC